jgi:hypothetical protein
MLQMMQFGRAGCIAPPLAVIFAQQQPAAAAWSPAETTTGWRPLDAPAVAAHAPAAAAAAAAATPVEDDDDGKHVSKKRGFRKQTDAEQGRSTDFGQPAAAAAAPAVVPNMGFVAPAQYTPAAMAAFAASAPKPLGIGGSVASAKGLASQFCTPHPVAVIATLKHQSHPELLFHWIVDSTDTRGLCTLLYKSVDGSEVNYEETELETSARFSIAAFLTNVLKKFGIPEACTPLADSTTWAKAGFLLGNVGVYVPHFKLFVRNSPDKLKAFAHLPDPPRDADYSQGKSSEAKLHTLESARLLRDALSTALHQYAPSGMCGAIRFTN